MLNDSQAGKSPPRSEPNAEAAAGNEPVAAVVGQSRGRTGKSYAVGAFGALLVAASFASGFFIGEARNPAAASGPDLSLPTLVTGLDSEPPFDLKEVDFSQFWEVWQLVKENHVDAGKDDNLDAKLFYGAVNGMVGAMGDPYSVFMEPVGAQEFADELEGKFEGIGAEIGVKKNQLLVVAPLPETPAIRAGLKAGDYILAIDGEDTAGMSVNEAVRRIRGEKDTVVTLTIYRDGEDEQREVPITRGAINVESVRWHVQGVPSGKQVGVIEVSHFSEDTSGLFAEAVRAVLLEDVGGVVLDLRNNPGGYLDMAVRMASEWVGQETIVSESFRDGTKREHRGSGPARLADMPTIVLVNGGSASASEIVAGALQDTGAAQVVGTKSFGKGSVQDYTEFMDGSALKLTVALWLTPSGRSINQEGISPDIAIENTTEDWDNSLDPQLDQAVEMLTGYINPETADLIQERRAAAEESQEADEPETPAEK
jgi:carboxyl-terminal processing protease